MILFTNSICFNHINNKYLNLLSGKIHTNYQPQAINWNLIEKFVYFHDGSCLNKVHTQRGWLIYTEVKKNTATIILINISNRSFLLINALIC